MAIAPIHNRLMIVPCNELIGELNYYYAGTIQKNRTMHRNMNACYVHLSYDAMRQSCHAVCKHCKWSHMHRHTQTKLGTQQDLWNASRRFVTLRLLCKQHAVATRLFNESTGLHVGHITRSNIAYFITLHYIGSHSLWTIIILVVSKFSTFFLDFIVIYLSE